MNCSQHFDQLSVDLCHSPSPPPPSPHPPLSYHMCSRMPPLHTHTLRPLPLPFYHALGLSSWPLQTLNYTHKCKNSKLGSTWERGHVVYLAKSGLSHLVWHFPVLSISPHKFHFIFPCSWIKFHCTYVSHFHYSLISWWTLPNSCEQSHSEHDVQISVVKIEIIFLRPAAQ